MSLQWDREEEEKILTGHLWKVLENQIIILKPDKLGKKNKMLILLFPLELSHLMTEKVIKEFLFTEVFS